MKFIGYGISGYHTLGDNSHLPPNLPSIHLYEFYSLFWNLSCNNRKIYNARKKSVLTKMCHFTTKMLNLQQILTKQNPINILLLGKRGVWVIRIFLQINLPAIMHFDKFWKIVILSVTFSCYRHFIDIREFL